ncbi:MAG: phosphopantetheine adenylyltransferase [Gammaproteobacteria bacterium]
MHTRIITGLMLIVAVCHLLPVSGVFGVESLVLLYQVDITDNNLEILMRHRAVLFGILGGVFAYSAFRPTLQPIAFLAAFVSLASFFFLVFSVGDFNDAIGKVAMGDVIASVALLGAITLYAVKPVAK